jgi:hypothetical protein
MQVSMLVQLQGDFKGLIALPTRVCAAAARFLGAVGSWLEAGARKDRWSVLQEMMQ